MRQAIGIVLLLNAVAVIGAALTGNLPNWPPTQADIHVAEQAGTPLIHLGGEAAPSSGGVISIWNDISISNSIFTAWLVMAFLVAVGIVASRTISEVPGRFQGFIELIVQALVDFMKDAGGPAVVRFLPLFGTLFLFALRSTTTGRDPHAASTTATARALTSRNTAPRDTACDPDETEYRRCHKHDGAT